MPIGLSLGKKGPLKIGRPATTKVKSVFADEDADADDGVPASKPIDGLSEITTFDGEVQSDSDPQPSSKSAPKTGLAHAPKLKVSSEASLQSPSISSLRSTTQATADVDETLYNYDEFLTARNAVDRDRKAAAASASNGSKGPSYVDDLLAAAEQRKRDQDRARDKLLQRQREEEGDEFKDKEAFVTEAYKANQEETRKAEEAERKREEEERKKRESGAGMTAFHRKVMEEEDRRHKEVLEAARLLKEKGIQAVDEAAETEESEAELAKKLREQGRNVEINEDGEITDKRELLSGGLNIVAKPKPADQKSSAIDAAAARQQAAQQNAFRGNRDTKQAMRERQSRMMEAQLEQAAKRAAEEEAEELQKRERSAKSQKTDGEISSAKERYLQRKREAAAAAARGEG